MVDAHDFATIDTIHMDRKFPTMCGGTVLTMEELSLDTPRNRLWSYCLSGSTSSCHDAGMLSSC